MPIKQGSIAGH